MIEKTIILITKKLTKNHFRPYLSDKLVNIGENIAKPVKNIVPKSPIIKGSVQY